jgi:hypothetical protein
MLRGLAFDYSLSMVFRELRQARLSRVIGGSIDQLLRCFRIRSLFGTPASRFLQDLHDLRSNET